MLGHASSFRLLWLDEEESGRDVLDLQSERFYTFDDCQLRLNIPCRLNAVAHHPTANNQTMEENMAQVQRNEANDEQSGSAARPVKSFRQGGVKVDV
jgi:hypothetical protein